MKELVKLRIRPSRDGQLFVYLLDFIDSEGTRRQVSLGHCDKRKANRERDQKERELRIGAVEPSSMRLSAFLKDSIERTRKQVREGTLREAQMAMRDFINVVGDIDYQSITQKHGEKFIQGRLTQEDAPATVAKKVRHLKRLFQLAMERGQLETNPLKYVKQPKVTARKVHVFTEEQGISLIKAAKDFQAETGFNWELLVCMALCTAMRRGELLNLTWADVDFERRTVDVSPKEGTDQTWPWQIKDSDRRTLALTDDLLTLLAKHQERQHVGYSYIFVPDVRYGHIQQLRKLNKWTVEQGKCPVDNFTRHFGKLLKAAGIQKGEFHDLRRTCLSNVIAQGLSEFEVMNMAGHAKFETTRRFYLAVSPKMLDRARTAVQSQNLLRACCAPPDSAIK